MEAKIMYYFIIFARKWSEHKNHAKHRLIDLAKLNNFPWLQLLTVQSKQSLIQTFLNTVYELKKYYKNMKIVKTSLPITVTIC